jgi:hypothetical protein
MILFIDPAPAKNIQAGSINSKAGSKIQRREATIVSWNKKMRAARAARIPEDRQ